MASTGVIPQPTGQVETTSTIENPAPASCSSKERLSMAFVRPTAAGSAMEPRAA
jgi:hypothetical protein